MEESADLVAKKLEQLVAPGAEVVLTTSNVTLLRTGALSDRLMVPLRAVAHLRKAGLIIENLEAYLVAPEKVAASDETSLRLMHTQRVVLINGQDINYHPRSTHLSKCFKTPKVMRCTSTLWHKHWGSAGRFVRQMFSNTTSLYLKPLLKQITRGITWLKPEFVSLDRRVE